MTEKKLQCPKCGWTSVRYRSTKEKQYICSHCGYEWEKEKTK